MNFLRSIKKEDTKSLVRGIETLHTVVSFSLIYFFVWRSQYSDGIFPDYYYNGKYVLMGVYGLLALLLIKSMDGFLYGDLNVFDLIMAQGIGLFATNTITYFQLCLIANHIISVVPILWLFCLEIIISFIYVLIFVYINQILL